MKKAWLLVAPVLLSGCMALDFIAGTLAARGEREMLQQMTPDQRVEWEQRKLRKDVEQQRAELNQQRREIERLQHQELNR